MNVNKILKILLHNNIAKSSIMIEDDVNIDLLYKSIINALLYCEIPYIIYYNNQKNIYNSKNKNYNIVITLTKEKLTFNINHSYYDAHSLYYLFSIIDDFYKNNNTNKEKPIMTNSIYNHLMRNSNVVFFILAYEIYTKILKKNKNLVDVNNKNIYEIIEEISKYTSFKCIINSRKKLGIKDNVLGCYIDIINIPKNIHNAREFISNSSGSDHLLMLIKNLLTPMFNNYYSFKLPSFAKKNYKVITSHYFFKAEDKTLY